MITINAIILILNIAVCVTADKILPLNLAAIVLSSFAIGLGVAVKLYE